MVGSTDERESDLLPGGLIDRLIPDLVGKRSVVFSDPLRRLFLAHSLSGAGDAPQAVN